MLKTHAFLIVFSIALSGCDQIAQRLGIEAPGKKEAQMEAEGKAVGSACRHSGRAIEDCYAIYSWLPKAAVYGGWREMDAYMRENQLETVAPQLPPPEPPSTGKKKKKPAITETEPASSAEAAAKSSDTPAEKTDTKSATKH